MGTRLDCGRQKSILHSTIPGRQTFPEDFQSPPEDLCLLQDVFFLLHPP